MLFKMRFHAGLRDGSIDLTIRKWSRVQVKVGGTYRFDQRSGGIVVDAIDQIALEKITSRDVKRAGFETLEEMKAALKTSGTVITSRTNVYRIAFHYEKASKQKHIVGKPTKDDISKLVERLSRMDKLSKHGPWTKQVLSLIAKHPQRRAGDLAPKLKRELKAFKTDIRKLKGMG